MEKNEIMFSAEEISAKIREIAGQIVHDFGEGDFYIVSLANGAVCFTADLMRQIPNSVFLDTVKVSSYHGVVSGEVQFLGDLSVDISGKKVLLVDDILDTGKTLFKVKNELKKMSPVLLKTCVLIDKPSRRQTEIDADYKGFDIPDRFIFGYGMDDAEGRFRNLPYIACR